MVTRLMTRSRGADGAGVTIPPTSSGVIDALRRAWPDTMTDPVAAAAYAAALDGVDPAAVETAVATLGARGRQAPPPGILRSVVISWQQAAATTTTAPVLPAVPSTGARARTLGPMLGAAVLLLAASAMTRGTWMSIAGAHEAVSFSGGGVRGGVLVALAGPLAALLAVAGLILAGRGRPAARLRPVLAMVALAGIVAVYGAMTGVMRVSVIANRLDVGPGVISTSAPAGVGPVVDVSTGPALWAALALALAATAAAVHGLLTLRGRRL